MYYLVITNKLTREKWNYGYFETIESAEEEKKRLVDNNLIIKIERIKKWKQD